MALVIGHRGARGMAPENTLKAIHAAAFCKADYVEVDVRLSNDGVLVLMHDETLERTTGSPGKVEDLSLNEIRTMNVEGQQIPTLRQAIDLTKKLGLGIVVEMKEEGIEELVVDELEGQEALVTSFYHASLLEIKSLSELRTGIIIASLPIRPVELAKWAEADFIFPRRTNPNLFKEAHRQGIAVCPWTVNEEEEAIWLLRLGADGLVTDNPCSIKKLTGHPIRSTGKNNCEYYPCHHFQDQDCTHCFCPLYPCMDKKLGNFVKTKRGKRVWTCIDCQLVHKPEVAEHLTLNPEATIADLKRVEGIK